MALNGALYAADKSDRIATIKMQMRDERATATIWSYAAMKAVAVAVTPVPALDVLGAAPSTSRWSSRWPTSTAFRSPGSTPGS